MIYKLIFNQCYDALGTINNNLVLGVHYLSNAYGYLACLKEDSKLLIQIIMKIILQICLHRHNIPIIRGFFDRKTDLNVILEDIVGGVVY